MIQLPFKELAKLFRQQTPTGWICPKCGRVYSPTTPMCLYCKGDTTITSDYVRFMRQDMPVNEEKLKEDRKQNQL